MYFHCRKESNWIKQISQTKFKFSGVIQKNNAHPEIVQSSILARNAILVTWGWSFFIARKKYPIWYTRYFLTNVFSSGFLRILQGLIQNDQLDGCKPGYTRKIPSGYPESFRKITICATKNKENSQSVP